MGDLVGPVRKHLESARPADLGESRVHSITGLPGLNSPLPSRSRIRECAQRLGNFAGRSVAHLMATGAAVRADDVADPFALASPGCGNSISVLPVSWKLVCPRQLQQRIPILRRIILRSS